MQTKDAVFLQHDGCRIVGYQPCQFIEHIAQHVLQFERHRQSDRELLERLSDRDLITMLVSPGGTRKLLGLAAQGEPALGDIARPTVRAFSLAAALCQLATS